MFWFVKKFIQRITPEFLLNFYHFILSASGAFLYRFPSKKLIIIGVTGTNGKSTVVDLTTKILEEAGYKAASLSSIYFQIGSEKWPNTLKMTMPGRFKLQKFLKQAADAGCKYGVLEVTSEGIKQHRHRFINFDAAVLTNLTPEHIESHGSFEKYREAKGELFKITKRVHIMNLDDKNAEYFLQFPAEKKINYKVTGNQISINGNLVSVNLKLLGQFNLYNAAAAICAGLSQGVDLETCKKAVEKVEGIPGRMEEVISKHFQVFVDYAFTPNALEKVYQTLKPQNGKMICVLGACGGGRDKWKRPVLGEIAARYCDRIILTNEDPYDENPLKIIEEIKKGILNARYQIQNTQITLDRREAIEKALSLARPNDLVIITGKGCEPWICVAKGKKIPWDDREVVKEEFEKLKI